VAVEKYRQTGPGHGGNMNRTGSHEAAPAQPRNSTETKP
jgi:hypothetical protein